MCNGELLTEVRMMLMMMINADFLGTCLVKCSSLLKTNPIGIASVDSEPIEIGYIVT